MLEFARRPVVQYVVAVMLVLVAVLNYAQGLNLVFGVVLPLVAAGLIVLQQRRQARKPA